MQLNSPSFQLTSPKSWTILSKVTGLATASIKVDIIVIKLFMYAKIIDFFKIYYYFCVSIRTILLWLTKLIRTPVWLVELARVNVLQGLSRRETFIALIQMFVSAAELALTLVLWVQSLLRSNL